MKMHFDFVDVDLVPDSDGTSWDEIRSGMEIPVHRQDGVGESSDSAFTAVSRDAREGRKQHEKEKNGKIIKPELNGWAQIAAPMCYIYLRRSSSTGHWYIGYTNTLGTVCR